MQYQEPAASVQPQSEFSHHWFQSPAALGLYGCIAIAALASTDLFFIASERILGNHLIMVGYWVSVGILSIVQLCVWYRHRWLIDLGRRLLLFVFVLAWAMLSTLWSKEPSFTAGRAAALWLEVALGILIGFAFPARDVMAILAWTFAALLLLNLACRLLLLEEGVEYLTREGLPIWKGITVNRNQLGALAAAAVFFTVALLRRRLPWLVALGFALLAGFLVHMTRSAAALILLATAVLLGLAAFGSWYVADHVDDATALLGRNPSLSRRTDIWQEAAELVRQRPFTGWGFNMVWGHRRASWFPDLPNTIRVYHAHNGYVQLAAELGVLAAALATLLVLTLIVNAFTTYVATGSAFALFCFLYFAMFAVGNLSESKLFFLLWPEWTIFTALAVAFERARDPAPAVRLTARPRAPTC